MGKLRRPERPLDLRGTGGRLVVETHVATAARVKVGIGDPVALLERAPQRVGLHPGAEPGHAARHLVAVDPAVLGQAQWRVTAPEVKVGAADSGAHQLDELHDLDVEVGGVAADRLHRCLHALDVAAVVGAPDVDHVAEAAVELRLVISDVGGEIGVAAVGFLQRPVDVVAEARGAKQRLLAVLVILDRRAFRRRQAAFINLSVRAQRFDGGADLVAPLDQRALGKEHVVLDVQRGEIIADHRHHHGDGFDADEWQPPSLRHGLEFVAVFLRKRRSDRHLPRRNNNIGEDNGARAFRRAADGCRRLRNRP